MSIDYTDIPELIDQLDELAHDKGYTKIIAKVPSRAMESFKTNGYIEEAVIPNLYKGQEDGHFLSRYLDQTRLNDSFKQKCTHILEDVKLLQTPQEPKSLGEAFCCGRVREEDVDDMVEVYKAVFKSYPFPIHDREYLLKTMKENLLYYGVWHKEKLVALASIELASAYDNAELTDFATVEAYRGKGLASYLLEKMENSLDELGVQTAYTIARAKSFGMNAVFAKQGYIYGGTLVNNTDIAGQIESMNIWYKSFIKI